MYGFQPSTLANRLLTLIDAIAEASDIVTMIAHNRDVIHQLIKLSKDRMASKSTRTAPLFQLGDHVYLSTKGLHIQSKKCKHLSNQRLGHFKVIYKVEINSYTLLLPKGFRLHYVFHCGLLCHASSSTSRMPHQTNIEGDHEEYAVDLFLMLRLIIGQVGEVLTSNS